jgi:hypothetical protein
MKQSVNEMIKKLNDQLMMRLVNEIIFRHSKLLLKKYFFFLGLDNRAA